MASGRVTHLILDFDGLILDTETPDFISWRDEYSAHGVDLDGDRWLECIGSTVWFDLYEELEALVGGPIDRVAIRDSRRRRYSELVIEQRPMPGVETLLDEAADAGIPVGVASSSTTDWVREHLQSHGLADRVEAVCGRDEVGGIAKPGGCSAHWGMPRKHSRVRGHAKWCSRRPCG